MSKLFCFCVGLNLFFGRTRCEEVQQISSIFAKEKDNVTIQCSHNNNNLQNMLWYQQKSDRPDFHLITYAYGTSQGNNEDGFKERFTLNKESALKGSLTISALLQSDSAVYYCAASWTGGFADLKFGPGTKLTVLEPNMTVTHPTVTLFPPSPKELCRAKIYKRNVTLVCVATDFYPDHISITWKLNGNDIKPGVATDHTAQQDTDTRFYSMSSRLSVSRTEWMDIKNIFTCNVIFFNGTEPEIISQNITFKEKIPVKVYAMIQLGYIMFVFKSLLYAGFVSILVWKCKGTKEKMLLTENGDIMIS